MRPLFLPVSFAFFLIIVAFVTLSTARGQTLPGQGAEVILSSETLEGSTRQVTAPESALLNGTAPDQPTISFIESPTAACVQPDSSKNECFLNWYYLSVSADPNYMITMTVQINEIGFAARYSGFFQTSMYVPHTMNPQGLKVACGSLNQSGYSGWGKAYAYTIRARASDGLGSANYGAVVCPAYQP